MGQMCWINVQYAPLVKHMHIIQLFRIRHVYDIEDYDSVSHGFKSMINTSF